MSKPVAQQVVKSWPHRFAARLSTLALKISGLSVDESLETLKKNRAVLDEKIAKLENGCAPTSQEESLKNAPSAGGEFFDTPKS